MNFRDACNIAYPLSSAINNHLRDEERDDGESSAIKKLANEMLADRQWMNTLESDNSRLDEVKNQVRDAMLRGDQADIEIARTELVIAYRIAAHKEAGKELWRRRNEAAEEAAIASWESKRECCE